MYLTVMENPKTIGERSEAMIMAALLRARKVVLRPFGDNQRYDLVIDDGGVFSRVQCKTARMKEGFLLFDTCSSQSHRGKGKHGYHGQIELFAVYSPDLDKCYLVPISEVGVGSATLRLEPSRNGQSKGVRMASDFELRHVPLLHIVASTR